MTAVVNTAVEKHRTLEARYRPGVPLTACDSRLPNVRDADLGSAAYERYRKPADESMMPVGAVCEPRLNSQRSIGSERDAGWERMRGISKADRAAIPPDVKSAAEMVKIWMACVAGILGFGSCEVLLPATMIMTSIRLTANV